MRHPNSLLTSLHHYLASRRGDMVEGVIVLPLMALIALALVNLSLAGYAAVTANNAANAAARAASVAQSDPVGQGMAAARHALQAGIGDYDVALAAPASPGGQVTATVNWRVPNFFGGLLRLFGAGSGEVISGQAVALFRKEGW